MSRISIFLRTLKLLQCAVPMLAIGALVLVGTHLPVSRANAEPIPDFTNELVLAGLNQPVDVVFLPDGRALVLQKPGSIVILDPQDNPAVASTYMALADVESGGERGLIAIALDPDFLVNNHFYLYYTKGSRARFRVSRFTHDTDSADPTSEVLVWENDSTTTSCCHYGGGLAFGPDGAIYLTTGDNFDGGQSQNLTTANGKILRFNKDGSIPVDNPFTDGPGGNVDQIWALGLRNSFRASWDFESNRFFIADVGGNVGSSKEDVHIGRRGANYGWPFCEGNCSNPAYDDPIYTYPHTAAGGSITGGFVYRGTGFPISMQGAYFFGDYVHQWIRFITFDQNGDFSSIADLDPSAGGVVALEEGPEGALYYLDILTGSLRRIVNLTQNGRPSILQASADALSGAAPHTVNFTASAVDPESQPLTYTWIFGDGEQATGANLSHIYASNGSYSARLSVTDGLYTVFSEEIYINVGIAPEVSIDSPVNGALFRAGDLISYSGSATDVDGPLVEPDFSWIIEFIHNNHSHPSESTVTGFGGTFYIDESGHDFSSETGYQFTLNVTDTDGLRGSDSVSVFPDKVDVTFETSPPMPIVLDGIERATPLVHDTLIGFQHSISVPVVTCIAGVQYEFQSWSDGNTNAGRTYTVPATSTTHTANYDNVGNCTRVSSGLQVLYDFSEGSGSVVSDRSGVLPALDLSVANPAAVSWLPGGGLSLDSPTVLKTAAAATRLRDALQASQALTVEAWVLPGDLGSLTTFGPARIVALSQNGYPAGGNFVLGQEFESSSEYAVRLRTNGSNQYGSPSFLAPTNSATQVLTHVVYTRDAAGAERLYQDGVQVSQGSRPGAFGNWGNYVLALGNEPAEDRPWIGELRLVAVFDRALDSSEVQANFTSGVP